MYLPVTSLYASLTGLFYLALSFGVIGMRRQLKVPYGDGGHRILTKRIAVSSLYPFYQGRSYKGFVAIYVSHLAT